MKNKIIPGKYNKLIHPAYYSYAILFLMGFFIMGCAFGKHGQANSGYFSVDLPPIPPGRGKAEVIRTMGVPDSSVSFGGKEYWRYRNVSGWFLLFVGSTSEKDLIIEFSENKVRTSYLTDKGSSFGILMLQGAVAN